MDGDKTQFHCRRRPIKAGKLGTCANNMHVYSDPTGQKAVIVIVGDNTDEALPVLANRLLEQQMQLRPAVSRSSPQVYWSQRPYVATTDSIISAKPDGVLFHRAGQSG